MAGGVVRFLSSLFDCVVAAVSVIASIFTLLRAANSEHADEAQALEAARAELNDRTAAELDKWQDPTKPFASERLDVTHSLLLEQIELEIEINRLLGQNIIRREPALRAAAMSATYQIALLLHRTDLRCTQLAVAHPDDEIGQREYQQTMAAAAGDIDSARQRYASVFEKYVSKLQTSPMRRERLARRIAWLLTLKLKLAFDRDVGINDLRQELHAQRSAIDEKRSALKVFRSEYFTHALRLAANHLIEADDAQFIKSIVEIVHGACNGRADPADLNYPILISRLWSIRAKLLELPAWSWSMKWRAHTAVLQAWLYLFAANGAAQNGDDRTARRLLREASDVSKYASLMITETALLERPFKPIFTSFSMFGRQKFIRGFESPPDRQMLLHLVDRLQWRLEPVVKTVGRDRV